VKTRSQLLLSSVAAFTLLLLYVPFVAVFVLSINAAKSGTKWGGFTFAWYRQVFREPAILEAAQNTLILAVVSTIISTILGTLLAIAIWRYPWPKRIRALFDLTVYLPVVMPDIVFAAALVVAFGALRAVSSIFQFGLLTMVIAHVTFQIAFVALVVQSRLATFGRAFEEAARDLYAGGFQVLRRVTLPLLMPAIIAGAMLAFTLSLDDFIISFFTYGPTSTTLPIVIYSSVRRGVPPHIHALSMLILMITVLLVFALERLTRGAQQPSSPQARRIAVAVAGVVLILGTAVAWAVQSIRADRRRELVVYMYSEYIDPALKDEFERQTGLKLRIVEYENSEEMLAKIQQGAASQYDVLVVSDVVVPTLIRTGVISPLDLQQIPHRLNLDPRFTDPPFDRGCEYSLPYQWGTVGLMYDKRAVGDRPITWSMLFDESRQPGKYVLMDSMRDMLGIALKYRGHSMNSLDRDQVRAAGELLRRAQGMDNWIASEGGVGGKNRVMKGEAALAVVYNGDAIRAAAENDNVAFAVPPEGGVIWVDVMTITAGAPNRAAAHQFINFILDAKTGAQLSSFNRYATPNAAAMPFIRPDDRNNPAIYPPPSLQAKLEYLHDLGRNTRLYEEVWKMVKR